MATELQHTLVGSEWFIGNFISRLELISLQTSIAIVSTQLNDFSYFYLTLILFHINLLFAHKKVIASIAI